MPANDNSVLVLATQDGQYLGGNAARVWKKIDADTLRDNLNDLVAKVSKSFTPAETPDERPGGFEVSSVAVAVTISAKGEVGILGTGVEASAEASLTLTLTRRKAG
jgi:hypothetical protein